MTTKINKMLKKIIRVMGIPKIDPPAKNCVDHASTTKVMMKSQFSHFSVFVDIGYYGYIL